MAEPSDLAAEVSDVVREHASTPTRGISLASARRDREQARRVEALTLRLVGFTYEQIGERLGISAEGAQDMVVRSLSRAENRAVEEMRELENARLDRAQASIWGRVLEGDLKAVDTFLRISQRRSKLNGLDAPTKIDLSMSVRREMESALMELERVVLGEVVRVEDSS